MSSSDRMREKVSCRLTEDPLDILVIGGGIVGSGVARDAALRGLKAGLVEQYDFASGTSSRSSRLLHGGLRYLAQGHIGLVHEASVEKKIVHSIAPHLASPLAFVFPTYRENPEWALWKLRIGVKLYDLLCGGRNLGRSSWMNRRQTLEHLPGLRTERLTGAVRYYDGLTNDARLVLDTLRSAEQNGALMLNYAQFLSAERLGNAWECCIADRESGKTFSLRTRSVVNAAGPWASAFDQSQVKLRLTKGIHIVVEQDRLPVDDAVVMPEGKRILFVIPWGDRTIIGTTDTDYDGSLEDVRADPPEIEYLLEVANKFFPGVNLRPDDVISAWAGIRPLISDAKGNPSDISRSHEIKNPVPGWWDIAGGKLTTYRLMAEQTVDAIVKKLGIQAPACRTADVSLLDGLEADGTSGIIPPDFSSGVVRHYCRQEWARHLTDVMIRRTSWHYYHRDAHAKARQVADWMAELLHWDARRRSWEIADYEKFRILNPSDDSLDDVDLDPMPAAILAQPQASSEWGLSLPSSSS